MQLHSDTIVAISTPAGSGAIGVIRLSGPEAIEIAGKVFSRNLEKAAGHTLHYGNILKNGEILDEAVAAIFIGPRSYTK
ncbi:MAG: tRNA uridine-5-carboxymethylaminomethyl(34) synthesis GTPase MnmE, partial [Bacteroidetes bacterium]|nr:tRNA uridine-5-carboxymethylaminomethyl(34) synthesis GTPase MnmE [Bacteroidota bacterium]